MTKVLRYDNVLTARVSDADFRAVCERADEEGLTRSEYLRYVARMVADDAENAKRGGVLLDGLSMRRLAQVDEGRCEMAGELASLEGRAIVGGD